MGYRKFLDGKHKFRLQRNCFNGQPKKRGPPQTLSGTDILQQLEDVEFEFSKSDEAAIAGRKTGRTSTPQQWKKISIFFTLPYWKSNLLHHSLDVMHIEKNVCNNVLYTLLNEPGKSKDHLQVRKDLRVIGVREDAWPDDHDKFQPAKFTLTKLNKEVFLTTLKKIKVPDGYSSNIS